MKQGQRFSLLVISLLTLFCGVQSAKIAGSLAAAVGLPHFEPGRRRSATLSEETLQRLHGFEQEVRLTYFVTRREELPAHLSHLEESVRDVLGAFAGATESSAHPFVIDVVYPDEHPDWQAWMASAGVAPWRARRVEGDGYRDDELWSSLRIGYGARPAALFNGVGPEMVDQLQRLILAQLDELRRPRRPRVAISAPQGFEVLREVLHSGAEVLEIDFDLTAELPGDVDLFLWLDAELAGERHLAAIERLRARGGSLVFAGHCLDSEESWSGENLRVGFRSGSDAARTVLAHFGLTPLEGLLLDPRGGVVVGPTTSSADPPSKIAPWLVRCTADHQDFRTLRGQPNGSLLFRTPNAFLPNPSRLAELNLEQTVLAGTSELASLVELPAGDLDFEAVLGLEGHAQPNAALCAILRPADPWSGRLLMLADSAPLADEYASHEHYAHGAFVRILLQSLLSGERMVAGRIALERPEVLPQLPRTRRALLHAGVVLFVPALLAILFLVRRGRSRAGRRAGRGARAFLAPALLSLPLVLVLSALVPGLDADLTRDGRNRLTESDRQVFAGLLLQPVEIELIFSPPDSLPPEFKPLAREVRRTCTNLAREFDSVSLHTLRPDSLGEETLAQLARAGIDALSVSTTKAEVTRLFRVFAHLRLRRGADSEVLSFPSTRSFRSLRFRLAHALGRLERHSPTRVAIFSQPPRLSPAQAALEFQHKGLFAPRESDVFSELEDLLREFDFEVARLNPVADPIPARTEAVFWMQPRRNILPMLERLSKWLHAGGQALVAGQHFRILSRQLESADLQQRFWPEPQFADLERAYFPGIGIHLERLVVFDSAHASLEFETRIDAAQGPPRYTKLETTQPFLVRAAAREAGGRHVGELLLPFPSKITWDRSALETRGLAVTPWIQGSARHWTYLWRGGDLATAVLGGEYSPGEPSDPSLEIFEDPATYAALFEGPFPSAARTGDDTRDNPGSDGLELLPESPGEDGRLLLIGNSKLFENDLLTREGYDHELFALRAAAALCLDAELASFLDRAPGAPSIDLQSNRARLLWRLFVLGGFPLLLLIVGAWRRVRP